MFYSGVLVDAWVKLDDTTGVEYELLGDAVEFCFGGQRGNFQLQTSEDALAELVTKSTEALRELRKGGTDE